MYVIVKSTEAVTQHCSYKNLSKKLRSASAMKFLKVTGYRTAALLTGFNLQMFLSTAR